jgi:D-alanine-D-alanine ligase
MKVAIIYNEDLTGVINQFGVQNKEVYNPKTVKGIAESLEKGGHNVRIVDGNMHIIEKLHEFMPRVIEGERMGMVFNMAYGIQGESRYTHLPSMLEMLGIPYVGSGPEGHALALDKVITKIILQKYNLPTPDFWVFSRDDEDMSAVHFPAIVKPKMEAVSYGLRVVNTKTELQEAVHFVVSEFNQQALVEQFIRGREFCVGLLGNGDPEVFPVLEIDLEGDPDAIQTVFDKRKSPRGKICPAQIPQKLADEMIRLSKETFKALGLRDFARVDIRMDEDEHIYILEINSMASLGLTGAYVNAAKVAGYDYTRVVNKILEVASVRYFSEKILVPEESAELTKEKVSLPVRIRGFLRSKQDETEKLLAQLVNINTHVRNVEGVNTLGNFIWQQLSPLGFVHQAIPQVEIGNVLLFSNTPDEEYDVLLLTHLDNPVPFTRQIHFRKTEHKLYGTAIWESKGGLAVIIAALRALRFVRLLRKMRIGIVLTTDNTLQGRITKNYIMESSRRAKVVVGLSGAALDGTAITSRSGAAVYTCQMTLVNADKAADVAEANAWFTRMMSRLTKLSSESEKAVIIPREVKMNSSIATLFAHGEASLSVRFNDPEQAEDLERKIRQVMKKTNHRKIRFQFGGSMRRPPMVRTVDGERLYQKVKKIGKRLDIRILEEHRWNSSNICFVEPAKPKIDGLGPVGDAPEEDEEYILRHSLLDRAALLALLLYELRQRV